jgi:hypothetical protein
MFLLDVAERYRHRLHRSQGGSHGSDQTIGNCGAAMIASSMRLRTMSVNMIARKMGYRELIDYDTAGVVYLYNTVTTLKHTPGKSPEVMEKLSRTMTEAIYFLK